MYIYIFFYLQNSFIKITKFIQNSLQNYKFIKSHLKNYIKKINNQILITIHISKFITFDFIYLFIYFNLNKSKLKTHLKS